MIAAERSDRGAITLPTKLVLDPVAFENYVSEHPNDFIPIEEQVVVSQAEHVVPEMVSVRNACKVYMW